MDAAIGNYERAVELAPGQPGLLSDLSALYEERARQTNQPEDFVTALEFAEEALSLAPGRAEPLFNRALTLEDLSLLSEAREAWHRYLQIDSRSSWAREAKVHLRNLVATMNRKLDDLSIETDLYRAMDLADWKEFSRLAMAAPQWAREFLEQTLLKRWAESLAEGKGPRSGLRLEAARRIADLLARNGGGPGFQKIILEMHRVAIITPDRQASAELPRALRRLGAAQDELLQQRFSEAHRELEAAERMLRSIHSSALPLVLFECAEVSYIEALRDAGSGREVSSKSVRTVLERLTGEPGFADYPSLEARRQSMLADLVIHGGGLTDAILPLQRAGEIFENLGEKENLASTHARLARIMESLGRTREAWRHRHRALALSSTQPGGLGLYTLADAVRSSLRQRRPLVALDFQNCLVGVAEADHWGFEEALLARARIEAALGRTEQARQDFHRALEKLWAAPLYYRSYMAARLDVTRSEIEQSEDRAASLATGFGDSSMTIGELSERAEFELRRNDTKAAALNLERALGELETKRATIARGGYRTSYLEQAQPLYERMVALRFNLGQTEEALNVLERFRARSLLDQLQAIFSLNGKVKLAAKAAAPLSSGELRRRLPAHTLIAVYAVVDGHLVTWLLGPAGIEISPETPPWDSVSSVVERLGEEQHRNPVVENGVLTQLHALLVAPWRDRLAKASRVIFVPTRSLYRVPFAALRDRASGRFLVQDHAVGIAPSASEFLAAVERDRHLAEGPIERVLLVGDPLRGKQETHLLPPLPGSAREIASLTEVYRGLDTRVLLRQDATPRQVLASLVQADLVHMAVHAVEDASDLSRSRLALAVVDNEPADLPLRDILQLHLPLTRLVVLAACDTNHGPISPSEGPMSLAAAFLSSGVPAVVASLWPVEDQSTARLSLRFHQGLRRGADALSALRTAQLTEIARDPERVDWTWASFQVFGGVVERKARSRAPEPGNHYRR